MFSAGEVRQIANDLAVRYCGHVEERPGNLLVELHSGSKAIYVEWPRSDRSEVWMTFAEDGDDLYQDWFECMEREDKQEFVQYLSNIPTRYFDYETRVKKHGWLFARNVLEYKIGDSWVDVFDDSHT